MKPVIVLLLACAGESAASGGPCQASDIKAALAGGDKHVCEYAGQSAKTQRSELGPLSLAQCQALCVATPNGGCTSAQMEGGTCHHGAFKDPVSKLNPDGGWTTYIPDICCGAPTTTGSVESTADETTTTEVVTTTTETATSTEAAATTPQATTTPGPTVQELVDQITFRVYTKC